MLQPANVEKRQTWGLIALLDMQMKRASGKISALGSMLCNSNIWTTGLGEELAFNTMVADL